VCCIEKEQSLIWIPKIEGDEIVMLKKKELTQPLCTTRVRDFTNVLGTYCLLLGNQLTLNLLGWF